MNTYYIGLDIGGTAIKIGLFDNNDELKQKTEIPTRLHLSGAHILSDSVEACSKLLDTEDVDWNSVQGIGVGVPGLVKDDNYIVRCVNLGWENVDLGKELYALTKVRNVRAINDAKAAALGEWWKGGHGQCSSAVMITLGTGIGGGVIMNGQIVNGAFGSAGELSHFPLVPDETEPCACGKFGHLQQYASAEGIVHQFCKKLRIENKPTILSNHENLTAKNIIDAAREEDKLAKEVFDDAVKKIAQTMAMVTSVIDPELFLIGGGMSKAGDFLIDAIRKEYRRCVILFSEDTRIEQAVLGNDAGIYGAVKYVMDHIKREAS